MGGLRVYVALLLVGLCSAYTTNYHGHQLWRVENIATTQADDIRGIIDEFNLDVWSSGTSWVSLRVTPETQKTLEKILSSGGFQYSVQIENLQSQIDEEQKSLRKRKAPPSTGIDINVYHDLTEIETYIHELADTFDWVSVESIGTTEEGRDIWLCTLAVPGTGPKPSVFIDFGIHAREWITHSTGVFGLDYLTNGYGTADEVTEFLDKFDVYIMPVYNPDGYAYSWSDDRYWRKNRAETTDPGCPGVDLNRNLDNGHWDGPYSSTNPCSETYRGSSPSSEPESKAMGDYVTKLVKENNLTAYFNIHSYSQLWMYSFAWTYDDPPEYEELDRVSKAGVDALTAVHGTSYEYGPIAATIYPSNGNTVDFAYYAGVVQSYTIELRDHSSFVLPPDQIVPTGEETWAGMITAIMAI